MTPHQYPALIAMRPWFAGLEPEVIFGVVVTIHPAEKRSKILMESPRFELTRDPKLKCSLTSTFHLCRLVFFLNRTATFEQLM